MTLPQYGQPIARMDPLDISDLTGIVITAPVAGDILVYDGADWRNRTVTGDVTISATGVAAIAPGVIENVDISATAAIAVTKLALGGVNSVLWSNGVVNSWASNPTLQQLTVDNLRLDGNIFNSLAGDIVINAFSGDLDVSNNDIENIGAAGNDFRAAQLDLVAGYIILGANGLNFNTTAGDLTLSPAGQLKLVTSTVVHQWEGSGAGFFLELTNSNAASNVTLKGRTSRGTIAAPTATQAFDTLLDILADGYGTSYRDSGRIQFQSTEIHSAAAAGTRILFFTTDNTTVGIDLRFIIEHDGSVLPGADSSQTFGKTGSVWAEVWTDAIKTDGSLAIDPGTNVLVSKYILVTQTARSDFRSDSGGFAGIDFTNAAVGPHPILRGRSSRGTIASPSATQANDPLANLIGAGYGIAYVDSGQFRISATENHADGSAGSRAEIFTTANTTASSIRNFYVDHNGEIFGNVDADGGSYLTNGINLFDDFDDVMELRRFQMAVANPLVSTGQRALNRTRMEALGIFRKSNDGSDHYDYSFQGMNRLVAGGIYQNRLYLDSHDERIEQLERQVVALGGKV